MTAFELSHKVVTFHLLSMLKQRSLDVDGLHDLEELENNNNAHAGGLASCV